MVNTSKLSKFLKAESVVDGEIITFIDGGIIVPREFKDSKTGKTELKDVFELTVSYQGDHKTYSPNATTVKMLNKAWGTDSDKWIGKQARINVMPSSMGKDMIISKPIGGAITNPADLPDIH